eukprot:2458421-Prymnesium_polylepis.2
MQVKLRTYCGRQVDAFLHYGTHRACSGDDLGAKDAHDPRKWAITVLRGAAMEWASAYIWHRIAPQSRHAARHHSRSVQRFRTIPGGEGI